MDDQYDITLRDRLTRAEQDIKNNKENFTDFKSEDFGALKSEVHSMRNELNKKMDELIEKMSAINMTMAKWTGALGVLIFFGEFAMKKFLG